MKKCVGLLSLLVGMSGLAWATPPESNPWDLEVISKTQRMVRDPRIQKMAHPYGLGLTGIPRLARGHRRQRAERNFPALVGEIGQSPEIFGLMALTWEDTGPAGIKIRPYALRLAT